ncbi:MAG: cytochrome c, partial [Verrucomicrobiota bacterium]
KEGEVHYQRVCMGCHQVHGNGQQYLAPPLVGSEWVLGSTNRLIALTMDGVEGPIEVLGKTYTAPEIQPLMPGLRLNPEANDEQLAAILTYVRNAWGNASPPIETKELTKYRNSTEVRAPWPAHELQKMK